MYPELAQKTNPSSKLFIHSCTPDTKVLILNEVDRAPWVSHDGGITWHEDTASGVDGSHPTAPT
jgi:hypothetical protein